MKESTLATKVMVGVLCAGVTLYLALYVLMGFQSDVTTTVAYQYTVSQGTEASAVLVREELLLGSSGGYVDVVRSEGEKVASGGAVALLYSDPGALTTQQSIRTLTAEVEQLRHALTSGTQGADTAKLDEQVVSSIVNLRALTASGDLSALEDSVLHLRTMVFRRDYSMGDTQSVARISQLIADKQAQLSTLQASLGQVSQTMYAPQAGVFSGQADGYESLITPDMLSTMTPQQLSELLSAPAPAQPNTVGKLVTNPTWYLAALFPGDNQYNLTTGRTYTVAFSHDYYGDIPMTLERIEPSQDQTLVVFSCNTHLADTTLLRLQTVDIVTQRVTGIRIPRKALRVETTQVTREDGTVAEENQYYVYASVGGQAEKKPVNVLYTGDTFYLVEPSNPHAAIRLRAGEQVILSTSDIYDGKVVG